MTFSSAVHTTYCFVSFATVVMQVLCYMYISYLVFSSWDKKVGWVNRDLAYFLNQLVYGLFNHYPKLNKCFVFLRYFPLKVKTFFIFPSLPALPRDCCYKVLYTQQVFYAWAMFLKKVGIYQKGINQQHKQCTYNAALRCHCVTIIAVEKQ
jgi:hypothetical protein